MELNALDKLRNMTLTVLVQMGLDMIEKVDYGVLSSETAVSKLKGFQM